jgi:hypothetical protein
MGDKKQKRRMMERLAEIANELDEREFAISRDAQNLREQKAELDERERRVTAASAALASSEFPLRDSEKLKATGQDKPPGRQVAPPDVPKPEKQPAQPSKKAVAAVSEMLKSVYSDYSGNVRHISTQISTVTAAMMCAAVTSMLEGRGFDMRAVFMREMEKALRDDNAGKAQAKPSVAAGTPGDAPAPKPPVRPPATEPARRSVPAATPNPVPVKRILIDEEDGERQNPVFSAAAKPEPIGDDILRIGSVIEFQKLGDYGFRNNEKLVRVQLPEGIQYLPGNFFYGCSNLREIWLPDSLLEIGANAFYGCKSLLIVHIGENSALREIGEYAFSLCDALASFTVPARVEALGTSVFRFCPSLSRLDFAPGSKLRVIGSHLLQNCTSLDKLRLPDGVTVIPTSMCYGCSRLRSVAAGGVDTVEDSAFYGNKNLRTVSIRSKKIIAPQAFEGCDPDLVIEYLKDEAAPANRK